jgi:hypothetical protein
MFQVAAEQSTEAGMTWFWLNIPLAMLFFLAMTVIPLWLVIKHPDTGPQSSGSARRADGRTAAVPVPGPAANPAASAGWRGMDRISLSDRPGPSQVTADGETEAVKV